LRPDVHDVNQSHNPSRRSSLRISVPRPFAWPANRRRHLLQSRCESGSTAARDRTNGNSNFVRRFNLIWVVQSSPGKYSAWSLAKIGRIVCTSRLGKRGVTANRHET
jgi:hypothetical protein